MNKNTKTVWLGGAAAAAMVAAAGYVYRSRGQGKSPNPLRRLFPVFTLPEPTGPYAIGTFEEHLVDGSRQENRRGTLPEGDGPREVPLTVWYPADTSAAVAAQPERYPAALGECLSLVFGLPRRWFGHLSRVSTHAFRRLPLSGGESAYPVLLFSPGIRSTRFQSLTLVEELVSRGYIVIGMDHPYTSAEVKLQGGRAAAYVHEPSFAHSSELHAYNVGEIAVRTADTRFVLDTLERWNAAGSGHPLSGRLDLERAGLLGHSYGGAMAVQALAADERFAAALSLEGGFWGEAPSGPLERPFMYLLTGETERALDPNDPKREKVVYPEWTEEAEQAMGSSRSDTLFAVVEPFYHQSFTDVAYVSPRLFARKATPERTSEITRAYAVAFFDRYMKSIRSELLGQDSEAFPEVRYDRKLTRIADQEKETRA